MIASYPRTISELAHFQVTVDKSVHDALDLLDAAKAAALLDPTADLAAAYQAGKLTPTNVGKHMIHAATISLARERLYLASQAIEQGVSATIREWIRANADRIITEMRPAFDDAAALVHAAGAHFPPAATAAQIIEGGSRAVEAHEHLDAALATLHRVRALRIAVGDCAGHGEQDVTWWVAAVSDALHLDQAVRAYTSAGDAFHSLAHAGFTLRMNTVTEAARITSGVQRVEAEAESARTKVAAAATSDGWPDWLNPSRVA